PRATGARLTCAPCAVRVPQGPEDGIDRKARKARKRAAALWPPASVRADAEGERQHGCRSECGSLRQAAKGEADVAGHHAVVGFGLAALGSCPCSRPHPRSTLIVVFRRPVRHPKAESRKPKAESRWPKAESRK